MARERDNFPEAQGRITHGPEPNALVMHTLDFIRRELPRWRDRTDRRDETGEERLNAQLCKHLDAQARRKLPAVQFHHEEKQETNRRVDVSAGLVEGGFIGTTYHSIDDPFIVIEGKRLPTPGGKTRKCEYVTGGSLRTGGIQRFKLGLHGAGLNMSAMVGYVQKGTVDLWWSRINRWISDLSAELQLDDQWLAWETLTTVERDDAARIMELKSIHPRAKDAGGQLNLRHLWIEMARS